MRYRRLFGWLVAGMLSGVGLALPAQDQGWHEELQRLRQQVAAQESRLAELELARLPPVGQVAEASSSSRSPGAVELRPAALQTTASGADGFEKSSGDDSDKPTQKWSGRIHADYWAFPGEDDGSNFFERGDVTDDLQDRILFRRLRLGMAGDIPEAMEYKIEFDFAEGNDVAIKDAYLGWQELPLLQRVLVGNQKRPYGLDHLNSSRYNVFLERPFVVEAFNTDARRFGIVSYGVSDDLAFNWRYGGYLSQDLQETGAYLAVDDPGRHHYQAEFAGRLAHTFWYEEFSDGRRYAHWAISGAYAGTDGTAAADSTARFCTRPEARTSERWLDTGTILGATDYELLGLEGVINLGPLQWVGEWMHVRVQRDGVVPDVGLYGGYMYLSYFLTGEHIPWDREEGTIGRVTPFANFAPREACHGGWGHGWGAWQLAVRYSYADLSDRDVLGGVASSVTFALNWWWNPHARLQLNYIYGDIDHRYLQNIDDNSGRPAGLAGPGAGHYQIIGTRFAVDF